MTKHVEHVLEGSQVKYGFLWWSELEEDTYRLVLPSGSFAVQIGPIVIPKRRVNWKQHRVSIGQAPMRKYFKPGMAIIISRISDNLVLLQPSH